MLIRMHDGTLKEIQINHYDNVSFYYKDILLYIFQYSIKEQCKITYLKSLLS